MLLPRLLIQSAILTKFATKPLCASVWGDEAENQAHDCTRFPKLSS